MSNVPLRDSSNAPDAPGVDRGVRDAIVAVVVTGGVATAFGALAFGPKVALSIVVGTALAASNLWALGRILGRVLRRAWAAGTESGPSTSAAGWAFLAVLKMAVLFGGAWLLMVRGLVDPIGLVVGYGAMPLGIAVSALLGPSSRT